MIKQNKKILIIRCGLLGDTVDATSVVDPLLEHYGNEVDIHWVTKPGISKLFSEDPRIIRTFELKHTKLPLLLNKDKLKILIESLRSPYDLILNLEIVEHVENLDLYIQSCKNLIKKNGIMFTATINRTFTSYIKAIIGAEYILRWLPIGTHDWNKFIKPEELEKNLLKKNFKTIDVRGLEFNPLTKKWKTSKNLSVNYVICSEKF